LRFCNWWSGPLGCGRGSTTSRTPPRH
jgi:hypothetical protein